MRSRRGLLALRVLLCGGIAAFLVIGVARCAALDRSAEYRGNRVYWRGRVYTLANASWFAEEETVAKTADGKWKVNGVAGDAERRLIVLRSFLDQYLFVDETYIIPTAGAVTAVFVGGLQTRVESEAFCRAAEAALSQRGEETFTVVTENLYALAEPVAFCYEGCAVAPRLSGFIGVIDGRWAATDFTGTGACAADGTPTAYEVTFWVLDESLIPALGESPYFQ